MQLYHRGFTLVELAIVLVIIGLIAGGVMAGSGMIRSAEVQNAGSELQEYETAINNFRAHYFALPGDYARATDQWGILAGSGNDAACQTTEALGTKATCNGNDDGMIYQAAVTNDERFRFWQHLVNADMLSGSYSGRSASAAAGSFETRGGHNVPTAKVDNAVYRIVSSLTCTLCGQFMEMKQGLHLELRPDTNSPAPLTPAEVEMIDRKFDDGIPGTGSIIAPRLSSPNYPNCTTSDDPTAAVYNASDDTRLCVFNYQLNLP